MNTVKVAIYGQIEKRTEVTPYDRNTAFLADEDGNLVQIWKTEDGVVFATDKDIEQTEHKSRMSEVIKYGKKYFRYNYTDAIVYMMSKATEEELREEQEWKDAHNGRGLMDYTDDGFYVYEGVGLSREHWEDPECREEYLSMYIDDVEEESTLLVEDFLKYEFK